MDLRNYQAAKEAYGLWRGGHRHPAAPAHWDDLGESWQEAFALVAGHAQITRVCEIERLTAENERLTAALTEIAEEFPDSAGFTTGRRIAMEALRTAHQQTTLHSEENGLLATSMTVLSECQSGPPGEQSIEALRDAVEATLRDD